MLPRPRRLHRALPFLAATALSLGVVPAAVASPGGSTVATAVTSPSATGTSTVLVTGPAAAVARAQRLVDHGAGFRDLPVIGGFAARVSAAQRTSLTAAGLTVTDDAPAQVEDADWGADSHDASAVYPQADGATKAWAQHLDGHGVSVAVVDTGINATGDLAGKVIDGHDFSGEGDYTKDGFGHGTFVAGIIAGSGAASGGAVEGVAPGADLVSLKVAGADGSTDVLRVISAIQWAVDHAAADHIRVLNLSLGTDSRQDWRIDPLDAAVEGAWRAGLVVSVSAGNTGADGITKPADDPYVISVGASDDATTVATGDDSVAPFSAVGPTVAGVAKPDLVAPGAHVVSTRSAGSTVDTAHPDARVAGSYFRGSGTSFSAPQVAGAAALLLQQRPNLSNDHVKGMLVRTADPLRGAAATAQGAGELDVAAALAAAPGKPANTGLKSSTGSGSAAASQGSLVWAGRPTGGDDDVWKTAPWKTLAWEGQAWKSAAWNTLAWETLAWETHDWQSADWNTLAWETLAWETLAWETDAWS